MYICIHLYYMYMHVQRFELRDPNCICSLLLTCRRMPHLKSQWKHTSAMRLNVSASAIRICCSLQAQLLWMLSQGHRRPTESRRGRSLRNSRKESFDGQPLAHWCQSRQQTSWCQVRIYWKWNLIDGYVNSIRTAWLGTTRVETRRTHIQLKSVHLFVCHFASLVAHISPGLQHQFRRFLLSCGACHAWSKAHWRSCLQSKE